MRFACGGRRTSCLLLVPRASQLMLPSLGICYHPSFCYHHVTIPSSFSARQVPRSAPNRTKKTPMDVSSLAISVETDPNPRGARVGPATIHQNVIACHHHHALGLGPRDPPWTLRGGFSGKVRRFRSPDDFSSPRNIPQYYTTASGQPSWAWRARGRRARRRARAGLESRQFF